MLHTTLCGLYSVQAESDDGTIVALPMRCRRYACSYCGPMLRDRLVKRISSEHANALLTLTCAPGSYSTVEEAFAVMSVAVNRLFKRIRRLVAPVPVEYLLVWELTRAGWPHAHIIIRGPFVSQRWLSGAWADLTGAFIVDIRGIHDSRGAMNYVAKYLAKDPQVPKGFKRYRCSRRFFASADLPAETRLKGLHNTHIVPVSIAVLAGTLRSQGYLVLYHSDGAITASKEHLRGLLSSVNGEDPPRAPPVPATPGGVQGVVLWRG